MLSVRLDKNLEEQLNYLSKEKRISKSKIIKESLINYFKLLNDNSKKKTPYELGENLFGNYSSGDTDLSTTYKKRLKDKINAKNNNR